MKIPVNPLERSRFYQDLIDQCFVSQSARIGNYQNLWAYYLWGSNTDAIPVLSKIYGHLDTVTSFLYSSDSTRFLYKIGAAEPDAELAKVPKMREHFMDIWRGSRSDVMFGEALLNSLVFGSMFLMPTWRKGRGLEMYAIQPHNFGVFREDICGLDRQEAFAFEYQITRSQLENMLEGHHGLASIMRSVSASGVKPDQTNALPPAVQNIIATQVTPNIVGEAVWWANPQMFYNPMLGVDLINVQELWVWDDADADYRRVTQAEHVTIFDRQNTFLPRVGDIPGSHPIIQIAPNPMEGYFWGRSEITQLLKLQDRWAHRMDQVFKLNDKITDPPKAVFGVNVDWTEIGDALNSPGGGVSFNDIQSGSKIESMATPIAESVWKELDYLDRLYAEASGITPIMKGQGESGVRSRGQTDTMARLGSSRTKKRAMLIEDALDALATLDSRLIQREDPTVLTYKEGDKNIKFIPAQFTKGHTVKVDAHSMSPIFIEDEKNLAFSLAEIHAIDRQTVLEMTHPGNEQMLQVRLREMEKAEKAQADAERQAEQQESALRRVK